MLLRIVTLIGLVASAAATSSSSVAVDAVDSILLPLEQCPQVLGCTCVGGSTEHIRCYSVDESKLPELARIYGGARIRQLELYTWQTERLNFDVFAPFEHLETLIFKDGELENLNATVSLPSLRNLAIQNSEVTSDAEVCHVLSRLPELRNASLSHNYLEQFECSSTAAGSKLSSLDLSHNRIVRIGLPSNLRVLNVAGNRLSSLQNVSIADLTHLDISNNAIATWPTSPQFPMLVELSAERLVFQTGFEIDAPRLESLRIDNSALDFVDFHRIRAPKLQKLSLRHLVDLQNVAGQLPETVEKVSLTDTMVRTLPASFFPTPRKTRLSVDFSSSRIICEPCLLQWALPIYPQSRVRELCNITRPEIATADCKLGVIANETGIQYGKYEKATQISCFSYGTPAPKVSWWRFRPSQRLGTYDPAADKVDYANVSAVSRESYRILPGGTLLIMSPNRSHVERYVCVAENEHGKQYGIYQFRLDYTDWYGYDVFHSVFWGGLATSLIVCLISFLLNITWILTRKSALWWIQRAERLSRVRKMVEAMEKYRVRQMESLHEKYTKRVQIVRDNYHQQVEALRVSYAAQQEKFQNYRAAQVDAVHSHLDAMRDGYNTQLGRVREYGSKRAEQLWESYERQVNRMRTFSLQHRLKMMRQYKVKQRYVNKLLESLQASSPDVQLENEEKVRAALEIPDDLATIDGSLDTPSRLSRSSSFHSLPEYVIDEQGNVRPGIIPANTTIRFAAKPSSSTSSGEPSTSAAAAAGPGTSSSSSSGYPRSPDSSPRH